MEKRFNLPSLWLIILLSSLPNLSLSATITSLEPIGGTSPVYGGPLTSVTWTGDCRFLATTSPFLSGSSSTITVYTSTLSSLSSFTVTDAAIYSLSWRPDGAYLAAGGLDANSNGIVSIYAFDDGSGDLSLVASTTLEGLVWTVAWCEDNTHIAAGSWVGEIAIYSFTPPTTLSTLYTTTVDYAVNAITWCGISDFLAAGGGHTVEVYDQTLSPVSTASDLGYSIDSLAWCDTNSYLACGGSINEESGIVTVFSTTALDPLDTATITLVDTRFIKSIAWCGECANLAIGSAWGTADATTGNVAVYAFDQGTKTFTEIDTKTGGYFYAVAWCETCSHLATGGFVDTNAVAQLYALEDGSLSLITSDTVAPLSNLPLFATWCNACTLLASAGILSTEPDTVLGLLRIYSFNESDYSLSLLSSIIYPAISYAASWSPDCNYICTGGAKPDSSDYSSIFVYYLHDNVLSLTATATSSFSVITAITWIDDNGSYIAIGGDQTVQVYAFADYDLSLQATSSDENIEINTVSWLGSKDYLAVGGQDENDAGVILLYNYTGSTLLPGTRVSIAIDDDNVTINGIAWDETTENLAAVGYDETAQNGIIRIYHFDRDTATFTQLFATSVNAKYFGAVTWCGNGEFLTITDGLDNESAEGFVFVYQFNATKPSLTLTTSTEIANSRILASSWCNDCSYLATPVEVGYTYSGYLQLFKANGSSVEAPTLYAKKSTFRFPSQLDIVNTIWWPAVTDAVAYNVYADANKTTLLKTVTQAPYTYVQHQIKPNTVTTYYVVSVDARGNESNVATISI